MQLSIICDSVWYIIFWPEATPDLSGFNKKNMGSISVTR